jgi:hypothetical protein
LPVDLNPTNRPVRTRMPGGVAGDVETKLHAPMPIPETLAIEPRSRGVLDSPPSRGMTKRGDAPLLFRPAEIQHRRQFDLRHLDPDLAEVDVERLVE